MCRFLLVHAVEPVRPLALLTSFTQMCRASHSRDDAWQGDGWGVAWLMEDDRWMVRKSLHPIWEDHDAFASLPAARAFAVHARSASFEKDKHDVEFNQPYIDRQVAFTFNGLLRGVSMPRRVEGRIGAQRIWNMLRAEVVGREPAAALTQVVHELEAHTREMVACNIGLIDRQHIYAVSRFAGNPDYYQLRWHADAARRMVCSEPLPGFEFHPVPVGQTLVL